MIDIYVLDGDLQRIGIVDDYTSLIWVNRYDSEGDCELYIEATNENLDLLVKGNYLMRTDDEMVCRIERVELDTDVENGNYMIVTGYDVKKMLGQRIIWSQSNVDGNVEDYIRNLVYRSLVNPNLSARQIRNKSGRPNFFLGDKAGFLQVTTEQATYTKVNEKIQEFCKRYGWGYKVTVDIGNFYFQLYEGKDRSDSVIFADDFENLVSTKYVEDDSNYANVALIGGEGEGSDRSRNVCGYAEGINRSEIFVDARDVSRTITWGNLTSIYPTTDQGGKGHIDTSALGAAVYRMDAIDISIVDGNQLTELQYNYPNGQLITKNGNQYYQIYDVVIADLPPEALTAQMGENDPVILRDLVYAVYLLNRGYEKLSDLNRYVSFEGTVEPNITFVYKADYQLGDKVRVRNEYGIQATARIVEIMEVYDAQGYRVNPTFEYFENEAVQPTSQAGYLLTEDGNYLTTETPELLEIEKAPIMELREIETIAADPPVIVNASKKISELYPVTDLEDGCCLPIVSHDETRKLTYGGLKDKLIADGVGTKPSEIIDLLYPVGSVITNSKADFDPNEIYVGTTWTRIKGRVIVGVDENDTSFATTGKTGGSKTHALTVDEMPSHTHSQNKHQHSIPDHAHGLNNHTHAAGTLSTAEASLTGRARFRDIDLDDSNLILSANGVFNYTKELWDGKHWGMTGASLSSYYYQNLNINASHTHTLSGNTGAASGNTAGSGLLYTHFNTPTNNNTGGGAAHDILQPYITKYVWERTA